jgi:aldehyde:ferredoxin oxidoreductase
LTTRSIPRGLNGKTLRINLTDAAISIEEADEKFCRKYLGGAGFAVDILWKELPKRIDSLSPHNKLVFAVGPVTGILLPGSDRICVCSKSPLTGTIAKCEVGGFWGTELKRAGYDILIIEGRAKEPVYLWIQNGIVEIKTALHLWGKNTKESQQIIRDELGDDRIRIVGIGPGGEHLVRYACIMSGLYSAAGRGGLGAVMGSKNLKAIAVRGNKSPEIFDPDAVKKLRQWALDNINLSLVSHEFGTGAAMEIYETRGNLPIRNFRDGLFPGVTKISATALKNTIRIGMEGCYACPVRCKKIVKFDDPYPVDPSYGGPEYETLAALGSNCGIDKLKAIAKGNELCNAYSLDTISAGAAIAFGMECFENGLLTLEDTGGIELKFGNDTAMLRVIELIAKRESIGDLLAEGTARASRSIGKGASKFAIHVKGLEPGMHDPRLSPGLGLGYMVNPHGADHGSNMQDTMYLNQQQLREVRSLGINEPVPLGDTGPRKVALFKAIQLKQIILDCLAVCKFLPYTNEQLADVTTAVTGWDTGVVEQQKVAERILTIARLFNLEEGFTAADDTLPDRFFQPKTDGALSEISLDYEGLEKAKSYYYTLMGWDPKTGIPMREKLEEMGIS